ncbi:MAG: electron transfer flavoprotein subunit beta/FixA family protein [Deltaproteobacteria bacterium]|nr:electron transfer flavoprotein subunit beta/FixA family protein [Deltaproteobacteria bacterium]
MPLHIIVCIKSVVLEAPEGRIVRLPENCALNPFDRPAIEMALRLRDEMGGKVTALSMGPEAGATALYEAISMGVDNAVIISDPALAGSDTLATSTALGAALLKLKPFDLVLFGTRTSDSDTGQVGPQTAVSIDLPLVTGVCNLEYGDTGFKAVCRSDGFVLSCEVSPPCALTIHPEAIETRDSSLHGIERAFKKVSVEKMTLKKLGISRDQVGEHGSPTRVVSMKRVSMKRKCEFISGFPEEQADEIVKRLKESGYVG